jgi:hypothetical protein
MTLQWKSQTQRVLPHCQEPAALGEADSDLCCPLSMSLSFLNSTELCGWGMLEQSVLFKAQERHGLGAFVSRAGCLPFLMSKHALFKETNKQSIDTNSSGFSSFVLNTNKQKESGYFCTNYFKCKLLHCSGWLDGACHHRTHRVSSNCYLVRLFSFQNSQCSFKAHLAAGFVYSPGNQHLK